LQQPECGRLVRLPADAGLQRRQILEMHRRQLVQEAHLPNCCACAAQAGIERVIDFVKSRAGRNGPCSSQQAKPISRLCAADR